jgi:hypothetical protein
VKLAGAFLYESVASEGADAVSPSQMVFQCRLVMARMSARGAPI